jgi:hypothetical protein
VRDFKSFDIAFLGGLEYTGKVGKKLDRYYKIERRYKYLTCDEGLLDNNKYLKWVDVEDKYGNSSELFKQVWIGDWTDNDYPPVVVVPKVGSVPKNYTI